MSGPEDEMPQIDYLGVNEIIIVFEDGTALSLPRKYSKK